MSRKARFVLLFSSIVLVAVLVALGFAWKDRLLESYCISRLSSEDKDTVSLAAERLVRMRSRRAVSHLLKTLAHGGEFRQFVLKSSSRGSDAIRRWEEEQCGFGFWASRILEELGDEAGSLVPALSRAVKSNLWEEFVAASHAIATVGPAAREAVGPLIGSLERHFSDFWSAPYVESALRRIAPDLCRSGETLLRSIPATVNDPGAVGTVLWDMATEKDSGALIRLLRDGNATVRMASSGILLGYRDSRLPPRALDALAASLEDPNAAVRRTAISVLSEFGRRARSAALPVAKCLRDADATVREHAFSILWRIGSDARHAISELTSIAEDPSDPLRLNALLLLETLGRHAARALPAIRRVLEDPNVNVRQHALSALWSIETDKEKLLTAALEMTNDVDGGTRATAIDVVGRLGARAKGAVDQIAALLSDPDDAVRASAATALGRIGVPSDRFAPDISEDLRNGQILFLPALSRSSGKSPAVTTAIDALVRELHEVDESHDLRFVLDKLAPLGVMGRPAASPLIELLNHQFLDVAHDWCAARVLGGLAVKTPDAVGAVLRMWEETRDGDLLGSLVETAEAASDEERVLPVFIEALEPARCYDSETSDLRQEAAWALGALRAAPDTTVPALVDALSDLDYRVRREAARALGAFGSDAGPAVAALNKALADPDYRIRREAARALGRIGRPAAGTVPELTRLLEDAEPTVRAEAAGALGAIGPRAAKAVPALVSRLSDADMHTRRRAVQALGMMGPPGRVAVPDLRSALRDESLRLEAQTALERLGLEQTDGR